MAEISFRDIPVKDEDLEIRLQAISKDGIGQALVYKTARVDHRVLDQTVGPMNWQKEYRAVGNIIFCYLSIWDKDKNQWVVKSDVGTQDSKNEKEKSIASDGIKRAGSAWGIGAELYDLRAIPVKLSFEKNEYYMEGTRVKQGYGLDIRNWSVKLIRDDAGKISSVEIYDEIGELRNYKRSAALGTNVAKPSTTTPPPPPEKGWLNKTDGEKWNAAVEWLTTEPKASMEKLEKKYKISKEFKAELTTIFNNRTI